MGARKMKSPELAQLASRMASAAQFGAGTKDDPFGKVKGLITDMIERLESEAQEDGATRLTVTKSFQSLMRRRMTRQQRSRS